jgi:PAS domain S-box-containing protein
MKPDETNPLMTWRARLNMSCEQVSRAWLDYTGYTPEQALGEGWTRALHPEDLARWLEAAVRGFDLREPFEVEYRLRRRDGEYRWMLERAVPLYADGVLVGYGGACVDIDAHRRMESSLARALERERRQRIATERVIAGMPGLSFPNLHVQPEAGGSLLAGVRVLVAGMDGQGRELQTMLSLAGAEVRLVESVDAALESLGSWQPDVLVSDLDSGGRSLIRELRSLPAELGGCLRAAALGSATAVPGYDAQLAKPVEPVALVSTVARLAH